MHSYTCTCTNVHVKDAIPLLKAGHLSVLFILCLCLTVGSGFPSFLLFLYLNHEVCYTHVFSCKHYGSPCVHLYIKPRQVTCMCIPCWWELTTCSLKQPLCRDHWLVWPHHDSVLCVYDSVNYWCAMYTVDLHIIEIFLFHAHTEWSQLGSLYCGFNLLESVRLAHARELVYRN